MGGRNSKETNTNVHEVDNESEASNGFHLLEVNLHGPTIAYGFIFLAIIVAVACLAPKCAAKIKTTWMKDRMRGQRAYHPYQLPPVFLPGAAHAYESGRFEEIFDTTIRPPRPGPPPPRHHILYDDDKRSTTTGTTPTNMTEEISDSLRGLKTKTKKCSE